MSEWFGVMVLTVCLALVGLSGWLAWLLAGVQREAARLALARSVGDLDGRAVRGKAVRLTSEEAARRERAAQERGGAGVLPAGRVPASAAMTVGEKVVLARAQGVEPKVSMAAVRAEAARRAAEVLGD